MPDAVPDRLRGAWIADDVCACEAFFIEGKTKSEPCGLPERGALPVFAFACACGLYFARGGRLADVPEPGRPECNPAGQVKRTGSSPPRRAGVSRG